MASKSVKKSEKDYIFCKILGEVRIIIYICHISVPNRPLSTQGSFSTVYLAKEVTSGKEYASK
jgi:hypothetical protein